MKLCNAESMLHDLQSMSHNVAIPQIASSAGGKAVVISN